MAAANGTLTPPDGSILEHNPAVAALEDKKRKREDEADTLVTTSRGIQRQKDVLEILEQHDPIPSFLRHAIEQRPNTPERSPKKARLSDSSDNTPTIASKLSTGAYAFLDDLTKDAERVSDALVTSVRAKAQDREGQNGRLLVEDLKQMQRVQAFEQIIKDVVEQEKKYDTLHGEAQILLKQEAGDVPNGHIAEGSAGAAGGNGHTILTLFGNAPTPKQLFSSMQHSSRGGAEPAVHTELPVEEISLPTGLAATKVMSVPGDESKRGPTFEEAFPPPYNLPTLHPPKSHRRSTTRDETIKWEFKDPLAVRSRKGGYTVQSLTVGEWLGYGGLDPKDEPSSPRERRKMRDRVLSSGESTQPPPSRASLEEALAKDEEALFRRAYASFAPSCDNSRALVPEEVKSMVWWHKVGQRKYHETFAIDPALLDERVAPLPEILPPSKEIEEDFSKVVEELDELDEETWNAELALDKTNVSQVLHDISELLETLASHQRIRNASLQSSASTARTPISPAPTLASRIGRPDSPADDEMSTYHALRREIAYLILKLPPYAVAKLNGDQLAELGVSRLITLEGKNMRGTMEEDQVARLAKYTAQATAHGIATLTRTGSGTQHYSSTSQRTPAIGQAANTRYGQSQYGIGRTPIAQPQFNRSLSNQNAYGTPSATVPRPGYGQPNQYSRPSSAQQGYAQPNGQNYFQRQVPQSTHNYGNYAQYNHATPSTQPRPSYPSSSQPLAQFQQRSHSAAQNAVAYQTNSHAAQSQAQSPFNRTASPLKPAGFQPPLQPSPVPRVQQQFQPPGSDRATPASYPSQPQTPVNGVPQQPRPVAPRTSETPQPPLTAQTNGHA